MEARDEMEAEMAECTRLLGPATVVSMEVTICVLSPTVLDLVHVLDVLPLPNVIFPVCLPPSLLH